MRGGRCAEVDAWEETLEAVIATAVFMPVIMDMGGNVGTQSSTIFTRRLVLGQISPGRFGRFRLMETRNGLAMGMVPGILGGGIAAVWQGMPQLGIVIYFSMVSIFVPGVV